MSTHDDLLAIMFFHGFYLCLQSTKVAIPNFQIIICQSPTCQLEYSVDVPIISSHIHRVGIISKSSQVLDNLLPDPVPLNELGLLVS